jgi:hypothetical protein
VKDDQVVAEVSTGDDGAFNIPNVQAGFYTVVVRGAGGFATVAVQVNEPSAVAPAETVYTSLSVRQEGFSATMSDAPVEYEIVEEIVSVEEIETTPPAVPGYGYGGSGFGGGGPVGGGGLGGGGMGLGGIAEVIDKIDNNDVPQFRPIPNPPAPISGFTWVYQ